MKTKTATVVLLTAFLILAAGMASAPRRATAQSSGSAQAQSGDQTQGAVATIRRESNLVLVDTVVTDKKDNYIGNLEAKDFHVFDNGDEQKIVSFSHGAEGGAPNAPGNRRYIVLFFDNSTMSAEDQIRARKAAKQFIDKTASNDRLMAVVEFTGTFQLAQNFTANSDLLTRAISGVKVANVNPNAPPEASILATSASPANMNAPGLGPVVPGGGGFGLNSVAGDFGARDLLLAIRDVCKSMTSIPGRKSMILFSGGFPLDSELTYELTATIDAANKANVVFYTLDVRGLVAQLLLPSPFTPSGGLNAQPATLSGTEAGYPHYEGLLAMLMPQHGGGAGGAGGVGSGGGGGGGRSPSGGTGGSGGSSGGGRGGSGGSGGTGGGRGGSGGTGGGRGAGGGGTTTPVANTLYGNPNFVPNANIPQFPANIATNQNVLYALASGTGGFPIFNTNDLAGGLDKIGHELDEYYVLGYVPSDVGHDGSYHSIKVKVETQTFKVRARNGYYDTKGIDALAGKPEGKTLEAQLAGPQPGAIHMSAEASYFYTGADQAMVNVALQVPADSLNFQKDGKEFKCDVTLIGAAYRADGSVAARFSDSRPLSFEKKDLKEYTQGSFSYHTGFDIAPGDYKLKILVNAGSSQFAKQEIPLTVKPYNGSEFSISAVVLSNQIQSVNNAAVNMDEALLQDQKTFVAQGFQIQPSPDNTFKTGDRLALYVEVYEPGMTGGSAPEVKIQYEVLDRKTNQQVMNSTFPLEKFAKAGNPVIPVGVPLRVDDLKPGDYELEILALDSSGNRSPVQHTEFSVN
jgi:VWFA-related protein